MLAFALLAGSAQAQNVVLNGRFDGDVAPWEPMFPDGLTLSADRTGSPGSAALRIDVPVVQLGEYGVRQCVPVREVAPGMGYTASAYGRLEGGSGRLTMSVLWHLAASCADAGVAGAMLDLAASPGWALVEQPGLLPPQGAQSVSVSLVAENSDAGVFGGEPYVVEVDDVVVRAPVLRTATNLIPNGDFHEDLAGWDNLGIVTLWSPLDADGDAASGSARADHRSGPATDVPLWASCVPVLSGRTYQYGTSYLIPSGQANDGSIAVSLFWYTQPDCTAQTGGVPEIGGQEIGGWYWIAGEAVAPPGARSAWLWLDHIKLSGASGESHVVYFDDATLPEPGRFASPLAALLAIGWLRARRAVSAHSRAC